MHSEDISIIDYSLNRLLFSKNGDTKDLHRGHLQLVQADSHQRNHIDHDKAPET